MSVQAGVWNFDGRPVDRELIENLSASLKQQGPDGESSYVDGPSRCIYRPFHTTAESRREETALHLPPRLCFHLGWPPRQPRGAYRRPARRS